MLRLGIIPDFREENWPSMDLVADKLLDEIRCGKGGENQARIALPAFQKALHARYCRFLGSRGIAYNADRLLNRMRDYPRHLAKTAPGFACYHVCDHAYANVVHVLPPEKTGVFCHDLDTFRCLFDPEKEPRPRWFKAMMRSVLGGLQKAAVVFHTTAEIRRQIVVRGIVDEARASFKRRWAISSGYAQNDDGTDAANPILARLNGRPFILHVGSCIPRKRIDILLNLAAELFRLHPQLCLVKVGDAFTPEQCALLVKLNLKGHVIETGRLAERELAGLYRHAVAVVQPSDAEGFGLPVIEALACGSPVVASAIPTLMEAGGDAATYCPVGAVDAWVTESSTESCRNPPTARSA